MHLAVTVLLTIVLAPFSGIAVKDVPVEPQTAQRGETQRPPRDRPERRSGTARIRGRVVSVETGQPLRRVQIRAVSPELRDSRMASTDADGRYELRGLPTGRYTLTASKGSYVSLSYGQRRPFETGKPIEVADGQLVEGIDFGLPRGSVITGRLFDEFGEPVSNASVRVLQHRYFQGRRRLAPAGSGDQTDDIGQFRIFGLPPGEYYLSATLRSGRSDESDDRLGYAPTYYPGTTSVADAQRLTLGLGEEMSNVSFALIPARMATISGMAVDSEGRPLASGTISARQRFSGPMSSTLLGGTGGQVHPDGTFTISNVAPGDYLLEIHSRNTGPDGEFASVPITVTGADIPGISIMTTKGVTARGQIAFDAAAPEAIRPKGLQVVALPVGPELTMRSSSGRVNEDWTFELRGLTGDRLIRVNGLPPDWSLKAAMLNGTDITDTPVDFRTRDNLSGLQVLLTRQTTQLSGGVTDSRGRPSNEYVVVVFPDDAARWMLQSRYIRAARPDRDGRFSISGLPPQNYLVVAVDVLEPGEETNPELLERVKPFATSLPLGEGERKSIELKLLREPY